MAFKNAFTLLLAVALSTPLICEEVSDNEIRNITDEYFLILDENSTTSTSVQYSKNINDMRDLELSIITAGGVVLNKYYLAFTGIHARLSEDALAEIQSISTIHKIQPNQYAHLNDEPPGDSLAVRSWGLDRIDQHDLPLDNQYRAPATGVQTHAYIIDSGVRSTHQEFMGRIDNGISTISNPSTEDCLGHGSHVSGTVLGSTVGVYSRAILHPVRVFGCSGTTTFDAILRGLEWVIANHKKPAVANMSLGANTTVDVLDIAVRNTVASGVTVVVAAGNSNADACTSTPAREPSAITVAASDINDRRSSFSNYGSCVDIIAPGSSITSAYYTSDTAYSSLSGTSMASPHACGAAALVASLHPTWTPDLIANQLTSLATLDKIADARGTPNRLLYVSAFTSLAVNDPTSPGHGIVVNAGDDFTASMSDTTFTLNGSATDSNGGSIYFVWVQMSGPNLSLINNIFGATTTVSNFKAGTYTFRLFAIDTQKSVAYDDVNVTVQ